MANNRKSSMAAKPQSTIRMTFEGMMVLFFDRPLKEKQQTRCDVRVLKYAPHHTASLLITRIQDGGAPEPLLYLEKLESKLWLDVQKNAPSITLDHFSKVLDLNGPDMYDGKLQVDFDAFKSVLSINDGNFYTQETSRNELDLIKPERDPTHFGPVAVKIGVEITLDGNEAAYFRNGTKNPIPLPAADGINYGICVSQTRQHHEPMGHGEVDAENYNTAINLPPPRKIHFRATRSERATPDAVCFIPGSGGRS